MKYTILALALLLTACGPSLYKNVSDKEMMADRSACHYEATKATAGGESSAIDEYNVYWACLQQRGYH